MKTLLQQTAKKADSEGLIQLPHSVLPSATMPASELNNSRLQAFYLKYPKPEQFFADYNPDLQTRLLSGGLTSADLAARPANPTLALLTRLYTRTPAGVVKIQLGSLNDFTEVRTKLTTGQLHETAQLILAAYPMLTAGDICLYIARFKIGQYGQFYGAIDPMKIMSGLRQYTDQRNQEIERSKRNETRTNLRNNPTKGITYEAYLEVQRRAQEGDKDALQALRRPSPE
ncbi:MAG: DUF6633 family protein [Bacteroides nordii]